MGSAVKKIFKDAWDFITEPFDSWTDTPDVPKAEAVDMTQTSTTETTSDTVDVNPAEAEEVDEDEERLMEEQRKKRMLAQGVASTYNRQGNELLGGSIGGNGTSGLLGGSGL